MNYLENLIKKVTPVEPFEFYGWYETGDYIAKGIGKAGDIAEEGI